MRAPAVLCLVLALAGGARADLDSAAVALADLDPLVEALRQRIEADFLDERIALYRGWWLSETELRLAEELCVSPAVVIAHEAAADEALAEMVAAPGHYARIRELEEEVAMLRARVEVFEQSTSWRITAPMRWAGDRWKEWRGE